MGVAFNVRVKNVLQDWRTEDLAMLLGKQFEILSCKLKYNVFSKRFCLEKLYLSVSNRIKGL